VLWKPAEKLKNVRARSRRRHHADDKNVDIYIYLNKHVGTARIDFPANTGVSPFEPNIYVATVYL